MDLAMPAAAATPMLTTPVRIHVSASRSDPARPVDCMAQVLPCDPYRTGATTGASVAQPSTYSVTVLRSAFADLPHPGNVVEVLSGDAALPRRLVVSSVRPEAGGWPLLRLDCDARGGARP